MANSLGFLSREGSVTLSVESAPTLDRGARGGADLAPVVHNRTRRRVLGTWRDVPLVLLSLAEFVHVQFTLKGTHQHPHTHAERFAWQTNIYLNVVMTYFALEIAFPVVRFALAHVESIFVDVGLVCDYFAVWGVAAIMTLPIELSHHAGDHEISRPDMIVLYAALGLALVLKTWSFRTLCRTLVRTT